MGQKHLKKEDYYVEKIEWKIAHDFIVQYHYSKGTSNTQVYGFGLFKRDGTLVGASMWLPPTRVAAESVCRKCWTKVLSLTRLAIHPDVPTNGASFLLGKSIKHIKADGRFTHLVTYADESQGHKGNIYRATNWQYVGRTGPYPRWLDPNGKQVAAKATVNRTKAQMLALGNVKVGTYYKHKFVMQIGVC